MKQVVTVLNSRLLNALSAVEILLHGITIYSAEYVLHSTLDCDRYIIVRNN